MRFLKSLEKVMAYYGAFVIELILLVIAYFIDHEANLAILATCTIICLIGGFRMEIMDYLEELHNEKK